MRKAMVHVQFSPKLSCNGFSVFFSPCGRLKRLFRFFLLSTAVMAVGLLAFRTPRAFSLFSLSANKCVSFLATNVANYVGETRDPLNIRMNGHRDDWRHYRFQRSPVAEHFRFPEHDILSHSSVCCIDHSPKWTDRARKSR